jgi:hypothetical protein
LLDVKSGNSDLIVLRVHDNPSVFSQIFLRRCLDGTTLEQAESSVTQREGTRA